MKSLFGSKSVHILSALPIIFVLLFTGLISLMDLVVPIGIALVYYLIHIIDQRYNLALLLVIWVVPLAIAYYSSHPVRIIDLVVWTLIMAGFGIVCYIDSNYHRQPQIDQ